MKKFLFATDLHYGFERRGGHKVPLHDAKAWSVVMQFMKDFKPDEVILGGDMLDCGAISHHNRKKPGSIEGLRLLSDAQGCIAEVIKPIEAICPIRTYITGNHEDWLGQLVAELPGLEGIVSIEAMLGLKSWRVIPQGGVYNLGKLTFLHGDQLSGGEHVAKAAVIAYERSVRFGHFHSGQVYTKNSPLESKHAKTGIAVPALCHRGPSYGKGAPNRWAQGFLYGYIWEGGKYNDTLVYITEGQAVINGKLYKG